MRLSNIVRSGVACTVSVATLALSLNITPAFADQATPATATPGANLLSNPSHEHPGVYFAGRGEINVTWNWVPFWEEPPAGDNPRDQYFRTPEFRPVFASIYPQRVHSGGGSDRWFNFFALNKAAGIMQLVNNLPVGKPVRFSTWVQLWSSNVTSDPPVSTADGNMKIRVCIQTDGGPRNMVSPNLKCSDWAQPYDKWAQIYVDATPISSTVIALIQSTADIPVQHNDAYADDSCFEVLPTAGAQSICLGTGYVPGAAASSAPAGPAPTFSPVVAPAGDSPLTAVSSFGINIRSAPSLSGTIVSGARRGDVLTVTGKSADSAWFQIKYSGGNGWVYAALTVPNAAAKAIAVAQ
jgi:hypothetical protein